VLSGPAEGSHLHFSLSHTGGLAACLVTLHPLAGVDVETAARRPHRNARDLSEVGRMVLAPQEQAALARCPKQERQALFVRHWTLKEAYAKACGLGLGLDLTTARFDLAATPLQAHLPDDDASAWRFVQRRLAGGHTLAAAVRCGEGSGSVRWRFEELQLLSGARQPAFTSAVCGRRRPGDSR